MVEVIYYVATSLDGYIATSDGGVEWLGQFRASEDDDSAGEFYASVDALLLGSHTYEFALKLGRWPSPDKPSWVFTSRRLRLLDPSITLTSQSPGEVIELLGSRSLHRAWLMGGGKLAASFHAAHLISRYMITVLPIVLGSGIPVFAPHASPLGRLRLVEAKPFKSGVVQLTYDGGLA